MVSISACAERLQFARTTLARRDCHKLSVKFMSCGCGVIRPEGNIGKRWAASRG
jgi:hypothetical protein